jgi:protein MpaA
MAGKIVKSLIIITLVSYLTYTYISPEYYNYLEGEASVEVYNSFSSGQFVWNTAGYSALGNLVFESVFGDSGETCLIIAGLHGSENRSFNLAYQLAQNLMNDVSEINKRAVIIPVLNPDGLISGSKVNGNGVDLNRNFPARSWSPVYENDADYPGNRALSEPESNIIIQLILKYNPKKVIILQAGSGDIFFNGQAENLARAIARLNNYNVKRQDTLSTRGSLAEYINDELRIPCITICLSGYDMNEIWKSNKDGLITAINY